MKQFRLRDVCLKIGSGATPRGGQNVYMNVGKIALIRSQNVHNNRFERSGLVYITQKHADQLKNVEVQDNDVLLNITGDSVARVCQVPVDVMPARVNQHVAIIRPKSSQLDPKFLYFYLASPQMQAEMLSLAAVGATRNALTKGMIENFIVPAVSIEVQRAIAGILGSLDDKIELNRRMNVTLEAMARVIFKNWFVDFGPTHAKIKGRTPYLAPELWNLFPDSLDNEGKPVGWMLKTLETLFDVKIGRTPPRKEKHHFVPHGRGVTWLSIKTMGDLQTFSTYSKEDLTHESVKLFRIPLIYAGTVIVSFKLTVGRVAIAAVDMCSNEAIAQLHSKAETYVSYPFTFCFMKDFNYEGLDSTSSIATAVNSKSIKAIEMIVPDRTMQTAFEDTTQPIFDKILLNIKETNTLTTTRDLLLPKLISGKIRLRDAEKLVESVV